MDGSTGDPANATRKKAGFPHLHKINKPLEWG